MTLDEELREMARLYREEKMTLEAVGERFGMTRQGVRHRFIKAGIARRRHSTIDRERLETLYSQDKLPISEIAAHFGVNKDKIERALKSYGIPKRKPLKLGGRLVDFLRKLKIGEKEILNQPNDEEYPRLHQAAKQVGIKISIRSRGGGKFVVTRLEQK